MAKIRDPLLFSTYFNIAPEQLEALGVLDPVLNIDTKLFIDPLLLSHSHHEEIKVGAHNRFIEFFELMVKLLHSSKKEGDVLWRNADRHFTFPEIAGTGLGYGAATTHGSAWGPALRAQVLSTAKVIVDLGVTDPDLFQALALFEDGIGPDRISDMTTKVIIKDLLAFNRRILLELSIPLDDFCIEGEIVRLPVNPLEKKHAPVILVPKDILRDLPIATDWDSVCEAAAKNSALRNSLNNKIGWIWAVKSKRSKRNIRSEALDSKEAFQAILDAINAVNPTPYDFAKDIEGVSKWLDVLRGVAKENPLTLHIKKSPSIDDVFNLAKEIVERFRILVEDKGLWKELWVDQKPRHESSAQRIFFAVADAYCKANNIDVTPEADSGGGPVDFKFSSGYDARVLVELKLSSNPNLVTGFTTQLEVYKYSEETTRAIYLVVDVGKMGTKDTRVLDAKNAAVVQGGPVSEVYFVNAMQRKSASKR